MSRTPRTRKVCARRMTARVLAALAAVVLVALGAGLFAARAFARDFLRTRGRRSDRTPETLGLAGEPFAIDTPGGTIRGWFVRAAPGPRPTLLFAHGWQSHAGDMLGWAAPLVRAGCHAIVYDSLGHGASDPSEFTSLRHMRDDLAAVLAWARRHPGTGGRLALFGHSNGAAAALLLAASPAVAGRAPGEAEVGAVIAAGAPTDPFAVTREWLAARGLPAGPLMLLLALFWRPIIPGPWDELRPIRRIAHARVPVLLLHGTADAQVGVHHARRLAAANSEVRLEVFEGGGHFDLPKDPRYVPVVVAFLSSCGLATPVPDHGASPTAEAAP